MSIKIAPSILAADFTRLGEQVQEALSAGAEFIHVDVMDGHFVPNLTVGPMIVAALKPLTQAAGVTLDVHLMIEKPERLIPAFAKAGADILTVHVETCPRLSRTLQQIKHLGLRAGVTLKPATPLEDIQPVLSLVDLVLVMAVNPGFGGQRYLPFSTQKIASLRRMLDAGGLGQVELEVDGGIYPSNAAQVVQAGATVLVAGTAIFNRRGSVTQNLIALRNAALQAAGSG